MWSGWTAPSQKFEIFTNTARVRLLSVGVLDQDQEQLEDIERLRRLGEKENSHCPALLLPALARSAPNPVTKGFLGTSLFSKLPSHQASSDTVASLVSRKGVLDSFHG